MAVIDRPMSAGGHKTLMIAVFSSLARASALGNWRSPQSSTFCSPAGDIFGLRTLKLYGRFTFEDNRKCGLDMWLSSKPAEAEQPWQLRDTKEVSRERGTVGSLNSLDIKRKINGSISLISYGRVSFYRCPAGGGL